MKALVLSGGTYTDPATRRMFDRVAAEGFEITLAMPGYIQHAHFPGPVPATPRETPGVRLALMETWYSHPNPTHILLKGLRRLIHDLRPDIIHCVMEPWALTCLQAAGRGAPRPGHPLFGVQAAETKLVQGHPIAAKLRRALYRRVLFRCDYFVAWSRCALEVARQLDLDGKPHAVFPAVGIDMELFRPPVDAEMEDVRAELDLGGGDELLVGYVGRFLEQKGLLDLITAMDRARNAAPGGLRLALMGNGPLEERLRSAASDRPWMRVLDPAGQEGVARFMRALDLLALPSKTTSSWEEQFGLVLVEAMATGKPILGTDCGAIPETVGDAGWIVPEGSVTEIAARIVEISQKKEVLAAKGKTALERVSGRYSDDAVSRQLLQIWRTALTRGRNR